MSQKEPKMFADAAIDLDLIYSEGRGPYLNLLLEIKADVVAARELAASTWARNAGLPEELGDAIGRYVHHRLLAKWLTEDKDAKLPVARLLAHHTERAEEFSRVATLLLQGLETHRERPAATRRKRTPRSDRK